MIRRPPRSTPFPTRRSSDLNEEKPVQIRAGYDIAFQCFQETPMTLMLSVHPSRSKDLHQGHRGFLRSEEHTSELQSLRHLVCRLLLEKKNNAALDPLNDYLR